MTPKPADIGSFVAKANKRKRFVAVIALALVVLVVLPADKLAIDNSGQPDGILARARAHAQGKRFWRCQLAAIRKEINSVQSSWKLMITQAQAKAFLNSWASALDAQIQAKVYAENPELLNLAEAHELLSQAEELKRKAGELEQSHFLVIVRTCLAARLQHLQNLERIIAQRADAR